MSTSNELLHISLHYARVNPFLFPILSANFCLTCSTGSSFDSAAISFRSPFHINLAYRTNVFGSLDRVLNLVARASARIAASSLAATATTVRATAKR